MNLLTVIFIAGVPAACFLFGYFLGQYYERKAWDSWLKARRS